MKDDGLIKSPFICPVCGLPLFAGEKNYFCPKGHSYDRAKSGYVNLLQSQKSSAKRHGDDRLMVKTRTEFLEKGYYNNLRDRIAELAGKYTGKTVNILDVGCGECFYTRYVADYLENSGKNTFAVGPEMKLIIFFTVNTTLTTPASNAPEKKYCKSTGICPIMD